jgi:membrane protein
MNLGDHRNDHLKQMVLTGGLLSQFAEAFNLKIDNAGELRDLKGGRFSHKVMAELVEKLKGLYKKADHASGGWLNFFAQIFTRFNEMGGAEAAAGLAYYALFSMFPLSLLVMSILGFLVQREEAYLQTMNFIQTVFPFSQGLVRENLQQLQERSGTLGLVSGVVLIWTASGFFTILARNINRAWPMVKLRSVLHGRLVAIGMLGALLVLLLLSVISSTIVNLLPALFQVFGGNDAILHSVLWQAVLRLIPALFTYLMFIGLYRWVPTKDVAWRAVLIGAGAVTIIWEIAKQGFTFYLGSGLVNYEVVYGSLGTVIALLVWVYFSNFIAVLGAHLIAGLDLRAEQQEEKAVAQPAYEPDIESVLPKGARG